MVNEDGIDLKGKRAGMSFTLGQYRLRLWYGGYEFGSNQGCYVTSIQAPKFVKDYRKLDKYGKKLYWHKFRDVCIGVFFLFMIISVVAGGVTLAVSNILNIQKAHEATVSIVKPKVK